MMDRLGSNDERENLLKTGAQSGGKLRFALNSF
jgi:hypothetical protein